MTIVGIAMAVVFVAFSVALVYLSLAIEGWQDRRASRKRATDPRYFRRVR